MHTFILENQFYLLIKQRSNMTIAELTQTHGWKNFMGKLYGMGAAVVIVGALFKIMHWPGAGPMLVVGLSVEALIFFFSSFEPLHEEIDWTLAYPELAGLNDEIPLETKKDKPQAISNTTSNTVTNTASSSGEALSKFDKMLENAGDSGVFDKLGEGLNNLNQRVGELANISDAALATNEYTDNVKAAAQSVSNLSNAYKESTENVKESVGSLSESYKQSAETVKFSAENLTNAVKESTDNLSESVKQSTESLNYSVENLSDTYDKHNQKVTETSSNFITAYEKLTNDMDIDFGSLKEGNKGYSDKVGKLNNNLSALNAIFEMQLNEADLDKMMADLQGSVKYSQKYNDEVKKLGTRLESLNTVYGNMLAAMNVNLDR